MRRFVLPAFLLLALACSETAPTGKTPTPVTNPVATSGRATIPEDQRPSALKPDDAEVPDHYIENELKTYLNDRFDIDPELGLKK